MTQRVYAAHGLRLTVDSGDPAVLAAMDLRLRGFERAAQGPGDVRLEFLSGEVVHERELDGGRTVYETSHGHLDYLTEGDVLHGSFGGVHLHCLAGEGVARLTAREFAGRDLYLATHPLATISLMELFKRRRRYPLHAACLANAADDGVLIAGPSGSGKSTLTFALARAGRSFLADDTVFLEQDVGRVRVLGFSDAVGITPHAATSFGELDPAREAAPGFPKRLVRLDDVLTVRTAAGCIPRQLVFPEIVPKGPSRLVTLDAKHALLRLVPDVLLTDPGSTRDHLQALSTLLAQVKCHRLESGPELIEAARLIDGLL